MAKAVLIKSEIDSTIKYNCNICSEEIKHDKIVGLKCNPTKHIFCHDCIFDWYKQTAMNKNTHMGNNEKNICPICRKNGGLLPICNNKFLKGITVNLIENTENIVNNPIKLEKICCNAKLLSKDGFCTAKGKSEFGGLCGKHVKKTPPANIILI